MSEPSKRLLLIDPNASISSPSMRAVVASIPELRRQGWKVELWTWHLDEGVEVDRVEFLNPKGKNLHTFNFYAFTYWCSKRWEQAQRAGEHYDVIFTVTWYFAQCDVLLVQFSAFDWERRQRQLGMRSLRDVYERLVNGLAYFRAKQFLAKTSAKLVLCVSNAVQKDLEVEAPHLKYEVLENCYNPQVFHFALRNEIRAETRAKLGYQLSDRVFVFVSAGHYRRKGFPLAFQALFKLRKAHPQVKFLVVGGTEKRLQSLKSWCQKLDSDFESWVQFTGMVPDVQNYLAGSDAFLFPSYSEAFALVEIEAAATGLPLFLTAHHGSEMIMEEGINGRTLPFEVEGIASILKEFVTGAWVPKLNQAKMTHAIDQPTYTRRFLEVIERVHQAKLAERFHV